MHVALLVTLRVAGPEAVALVRERLVTRVVPDRDISSWRRWWNQRRRGDRCTAGPGRPRNRELDAPDVIEFRPLTTQVITQDRRLPR